MDTSNSFSKCAESLALASLAPSLAPRSHIISGEVSKGPSANVKSSAAAHAEGDIGLEETGETGELGAGGRSLVLQLQGSSQRFQYIFEVFVVLHRPGLIHYG